MSVNDGILFVSFENLFGNRFNELANPNVHEQCVHYALLEEENVVEISANPTLWLNISVITVRLLQLLRDDPRKIGLVSPIYFDEQWHNQLFKDDPIPAFLTNPGFNDIILAPIYQNRTHFTMAIIQFDEEEEIVKIDYCDSYGAEITDFTEECLVKLVTAIYTDEVEFEITQVKEYDKQNDHCNCAPFAASNAECFLKNGRIMRLGEDGYTKRWYLQNQLGIMFNHPTNIEIANIMNRLNGRRNNQTRNERPQVLKQQSANAKYQANKRANETDVEKIKRLKQDSQPISVQRKVMLKKENV